MQIRKLLRAMVVAGVIAAGFQVGLSAAAGASSLTTVSWAVSQPAPSAAGVRYTWSFTTASSATLSSVSFTVPGETGGNSLSVADAYGVPSGGTATMTGTTVTYAFPSATSIAAGVQVLVAVDGFINTSFSGTYVSQVTTLNGTTPVDGPTFSNGVAFNSSAVGVTVVVARSTSFTSDTSSFALLMDPSNPTLSDQSKTVNLSVATNAGSGYTLSASSTGLTGGAYTLPPVSTGTGQLVAPASFPADHWGYTVGTITGQATSGLGGEFAGYTSAGQTIASSPGPTNGDGVPVTTRVKVDYQQAAADYSGTISYTVTPSY